MKIDSQRWWVRYGVALLATAVALAARWVMGPIAGDSVPYQLFFLSTALAAWFGGWGPGLAALLAGGVTGFELFVVRLGADHRWTGPNGLKLELYVVVGGMLVAMAQWGRWQLEKNQRRARDEAHTAEVQRALAQKAEEGERTLRALMDHIPEGITIVDADMRIIMRSRHAQGLLGQLPAGTTVAAAIAACPVFHGDGRTPMAHTELPLARAVRGEIVNDMETVQLQPDGRRLHLLSCAAPIRDRKGTIVGGIVAWRDVSQQRIAEQKRRSLMAESERNRLQLEAVFQSVADGIVVTDMKGDFLLANESQARINGFASVAKMSQKLAFYAEFYELHHPEGGTVPVEQWPLMKVLRGESVENWVLRVRRTDVGREWMISFSGKPVRDDKGKQILAVIITRDITEQEKATRALRDSEERFRTMVDNISQLAWMAYGDGYIFWYNRGWYEYSGTTPKQMEGWGWQSVHDPQMLPGVLEKWKAAIDAGEPFEMEFPLRAADGSFGWFLTRIIPLKDATGKVIRWFGTNTNITHRKAVEENLAAAKRAAEEATRARDFFLAALSHELRTPLAPVLTTASLLSQDPQLPQRFREDVELIRRNAELESRLIDDLLDVTSITQGKVQLSRKPLKLEDVIRGAVEICGADIQSKGLSLHVDFGPEPGYVLDGDGLRLRQVFWNLLKNAIKFTPREGRLRIACSRADGRVIAEVSDNGQGIDASVLPHIFNPFEQGSVRVTQQFAGLGLGLTICKGLVELHGGSIEAHSAGAGHGATFRVTLPLPQLRQPVVAPDPPGGISAAGNRKPKKSRILLVEDHADTARVMVRLLKVFGHDVELACTIATALEITVPGKFDLIISDLGLPDGFGTELIIELRKRRINIPAIALTGYGQDLNVRQCLEAGFAAHLTKPASPDRLAEMIGRLTAWGADSQA